MNKMPFLRPGPCWHPGLFSSNLGSNPFEQGRRPRLRGTVPCNLLSPYTSTVPSIVHISPCCQNLLEPKFECPARHIAAGGASWVLCLLGTVRLLPGLLPEVPFLSCFLPSSPQVSVKTYVQSGPFSAPAIQCGTRAQVLRVHFFCFVLFFN